jgi:hypothetical protein
MAIVTSVCIGCGNLFDHEEGEAATVKTAHGAEHIFCPACETAGPAQSEEQQQQSQALKFPPPPAKAD